MMNTTITREMVMEQLETMGYTVEAHDKITNGVVKKGIRHENGADIRPVVYVEDMIEDIGENVELEEIVEFVASIFNTEKPDFDVEMLGKPDYILKNVRIGIQKVSNEDLIKGECEFEGLETYLYVKCGEAGTYKLTKELAKSTKLSYEELWRKAKGNTRNNTIVQNLHTVINDMFGDVEDIDFENEDTGIYVLSNRERCKGASGAVDKQLLSLFANKINAKGFVVLPSSIHEMLLIPIRENEEVDMNFFSEMVREVNTTQVEPEERLTDRAYKVEF